GWLDVDLTERGRHQAEALARRLSKEGIAAVYSSDLKRAIQTASVIADACGVELRVEAALREINYGDWEGRSYKEIEGSSDEWREMLKRRKADAMRFRAPNGESFIEFVERVTRAFDEIAERHLDQSIAIVAHKMTNRVILCHALGISPGLWFTLSQDEACLNLVMRVNGFGYVVSCINDLCHLSEG
ncbi:MAG: histidine phosphatase family protein, partial [Armatimonadetes bacterium]|nr:histidine phosphatase family protein [Armatimonadota bacterium]